MIVFYRVPRELENNYVSWKSDTKHGRKQWLNRAENAEDYFFSDVDQTGTTLTSTQFSRIIEATAMPFSMNPIYPVIKQELAILKHTKPSMRVMSLDGRAKQHAAILDKMKHAILYNSRAQIEIESMIQDMLIAGMGALMCVPMSRDQGGLFNTGVAYVPFDEIILDINAKKRTLMDMEGYFIEKAFTLTKFLTLYGDIMAGLKDPASGQPVDVESFTNTTWMEDYMTDKQKVTTTQWNQDNFVVVREFYDKIFTTMYVVPDPRTGTYKYLFAENLDLDQETLLATAVDTVPGIYIRKKLIFGDFVTYEEVMPYTRWPLVVTFFEWGGRPYRSYSAVHYTKGMGEAYEKALHIMILNGLLTNNSGWKAPKGSIAEEDRPKWEDYANNPRVIKEYVPVVREGQVFVPEREKIEPIGQFFPYLLDLLKNGIEYSTGITPILQGDAREANVEVFSSLQQYQNAAMQRVQLSTAHINEAMIDLGQVMVENMTANIGPDNYQFFDDKGNLNELEIAQEIANDIKSYRYLVVSIPSTAMPTQRLAMATELAKIAQSTADPLERSLYTQTAIDLTELREFDDLKEQLDVVKRTQGQLNDLQEAYDRLMETSKQMENKYINISLENRILKQLMSKEQAITKAYAEMESKISMAQELAQKDAKDKQAKKEGK